MTDFAIHVQSLSKQYRIGGLYAKRDLRETLSSTLVGPWRRLRSMGAGHDPAALDVPVENLIWALRDVSFQVKMGQAVGVIGNNGSGKSTLLKILSRIVEPTEGFADIRGRVGSLLEVGSGFNFELTGRENIFLSGAILGMRRREIEVKFDEIVAFAGVHKFIDTPVKYYSTGMYMRLAFAVAAHLETEILLVDEVLAVGDAAFQKKCLAKMEDVTRQGRTIFLVTHNMASVQALCDHVIWLQDGSIKAQGAANDVVAQYAGAASVTVTKQSWDDPATAPGTDKVRLRRVSIEPEDADARNAITISSPLRLEVEYWNMVGAADLSVGIHLYKEPSILVFTTLAQHDTMWPRRPTPGGLFRSTCHIPGKLLNTGVYGVHLVFMERETSVAFYLADALMFEAHEEMRRGWVGEWGGVVRPELDWTTEPVEPALVSDGAAEPASPVGR
jgi:lipopolysaccharide transport system ATP-binding protein